MKGAEASRRRAALLNAIAACSAVAALGACGGLEFENHPPQPRLASGGVGGAADFGSVPVGTSKRLTVLLGNGQVGPETYETLRGIGITVEGPNLSFDSTCPADGLPQAGVCSIDLTWTPASAYVLAGRVRVTSNAPDSPTTLAISGTAVR